MDSNVKVLVMRKLPRVIEARMKKLFITNINYDDHIYTKEEIQEALQYTDVLVPTVTDHIDADIIQGAGKQLKLIANFGNGVDNIDVDAAHEANIIVTNTPSVLTEDTADMVMALILALPRRMVEGDRLVREGNFMGWSPNWMLGRRLSGKMLGIVGMGRIGQAVSRRAGVFGIKICYHSRRQLHPRIEAQLNAVYWQDLNAMLRQVDILSIHCPYTPETHHLFSEERLKLLKPEAYLVNTSRGKIVNEDVLAHMLEKGKLAGAALDVFEKEPAVNPRLLKLENIILLPHMSSATIEGRLAMGEKVLINIHTFADGHNPPDRVLPSKIIRNPY